MNEDTKVIIVIICVLVGLSPLFVYMGMVAYDDSKRGQYYENIILNRLKSETCSELNASRSIYDPAFQGELLPHETMIDQAWKEKCS